MHHNEILFSLLYIFVAAQIGAEIAQRLKLPSVVGEIAAGIVVGPSLLGLVSVAPMFGGHPNEAAEPLKMLAEVGAVLLLFSVGLETRLGDLKKVGSSAMQVGTIGLIVPFILAGIWGARVGSRHAALLVYRGGVCGDERGHHGARVERIGRAEPHRIAGNFGRGGH